MANHRSVPYYLAFPREASSGLHFSQCMWHLSATSYADYNQLYITFKVTFLLAKRFSDLDNPDCLDFRANRNKNLNKIDPYSSCLPQSSSQFQRIVFYFFLLNQASRGETERKLALYLVVVHTGFLNLKLSGI